MPKLIKAKLKWDSGSDPNSDDNQLLAKLEKSDIDSEWKKYLKNLYIQF